MTKGDILKSLSSQLEIFNIPDFIHFTVDEWNNDRENLIRKILFIESDVLVVRSSALGEDSLENSKAGEYESILNVKKSKCREDRRKKNRITQTKQDGPQI